ncbi:hypothetical protein [Bradyrhizobium stylosanthis]|uniref:Uncharacterized protein n=1 Tax=Bradyrhizobium stylosanthis TaxID=1803665 RepID=A0A560CXH3_9BRAD|nr:hypothetical protein [Bradyrhizobium stylosanthis]TWA89568.1 hypothetical protein FBZ96_11936 [Bradyrhizobium stylosanthis]
MTEDTAVEATETVEQSTEAAPAPKHSDTLLDLVKRLAHDASDEVVDAIRHIESAAATLASKAL